MMLKNSLSALAFLPSVVSRTRFDHDVEPIRSPSLRIRVAGRRRRKITQSRFRELPCLYQVKDIDRLTVEPGPRSVAQRANTMAEALFERFFVCAKLSDATGAQECLARADDTPLTDLSRRMAAIVEQFDGRILIKFDDEVAVVFSGLLAAVEATRAIHRDLATDISKHGVALRISLFEPATPAHDGAGTASAIAITQQLARRADAGQTLACVQNLDPIDANLLCAQADADIQEWLGKTYASAAPVQRILWQDEALTRTAIAGASAARITRVGRLVLRWRDRRLVLDKDTRPVTLGRSSSVDVPIDSGFASREHAHLRYINSCFVLTDRSRNGTYVNMDDSEVYIHDDDLILRESGCISMGRRAASSRGQVIYFSTEAAVEASAREDTGA